MAHLDLTLDQQQIDAARQWVCCHYYDMDPAGDPGRYITVAGLAEIVQENYPGALPAFLADNRPSAADVRTAHHTRRRAQIKATKDAHQRALSALRESTDSVQALGGMLTQPDAGVDLGAYAERLEREVRLGHIRVTLAVDDAQAATRL